MAVQNDRQWGFCSHYCFIIIYYYYYYPSRRKSSGATGNFKYILCFFWSEKTFNNDSNGHCPLGRRNEMGQGETRHQEMSLPSSTSGGGVRGQWSLLSSTHPIEFAHPTIATKLDFQRNTDDQTGKRGARGMEQSGHANRATTQIGRCRNRNSNKQPTRGVHHHAVRIPARWEERVCGPL